MQFIKLIGLLAVSAMFTASGVFAQDSAKSGDGIMWNDGPATQPVKHKTIELVRVVMQIPTKEPVGKGGDCLFGLDTYPIYVTRSGDMPVQDYRDGFSSQLNAAGYTSSTSDSLFDQHEDTEAKLLVAGAITALNTRTCIDPITETTATANTRMTVAWQLYDPLERKVIFKGTSEGQVKTKSTPQTLTAVTMREAFTDAARNLFALQEFRQITAVSADEQNAASQLAQIPQATTSIPNLPLSTQAFKDHIPNIQAQVVTVRTSSGTGSGFYIADGLLLTNHHVAAKGNAVKIRFLSGKEIMGLSIASNAKRDVALIRTENVGLPGLPLHIQEPEVGSQTYAVGSPKGQDFEGTVSAGIVSSLRDYDKSRWIQSDVAVTHGSSGGPLFDGYGNVLGLTDRNADDADKPVNMNLFIPIAEALTSVGVVVDPPVSKTAKVSANKKKN